MIPYEDFLRAKVAQAPSFGFDIELSEINPILKDHNKAMVQWAVEGGRRGIFAAFGLAKTVTQIEVVRITRERAGGMGLIILPLGVRQEFIRDAQMLATGIHPNITAEQRAQLAAWQKDRPDRVPRLKFIRSIEECDDPNGIYLTNYQTVRDGKLDPRLFSVCSLDEASCLRGFGGTKTFREFMRLFTTDAGPQGNRRQEEGVKYRFVATATPSPNEYIELLAYSAYLGIMDVSAAKTRFFKRNSEKADTLTIHPHKEHEFWMWVATWGLFVQRPSDLGFSDEGYILPDLDIRWHEIPTDHSKAGFDKNAQGRLFTDATMDIQSSAREKRLSLDGRIAKMMELRAEDPTAHRILWHDLEAERVAIERAIPTVVSVYGSQKDEDKERGIIGFSDGDIAELAGKPTMLGSGTNFQRHCAWAIYLGIGHKFNDFFQSVHRLQRFLQTKTVRVDLIYTEAERGIRRNLERKWKQHKEMMQKMSEIIKEYGLSIGAMTAHLTRAMGVKDRIVISGERYRLVNDDCVLEARRMESNSVHMVLTSIPFSTQYEYSPNYADMGHTDNNGHFFAHLDYLIPELFRILQPGRLAAIHVKDRITPTGLSGMGFQTLYRFGDKTCDHFEAAGFGLVGKKTIITDVVRENAQTYRLGWSEQCKDGTKMGFGVPEQLLLFRKPPTDTSNGYADMPVTKGKDRYTRSRWQMDAHGFTRSNGDRPLMPEDLEGLTHAQIFQAFKKYSLSEIFDFEHVVRIAESLELKGRLPSDFMLLQPQSWSDEVWTDITRMRTLNQAQSAKGKEMHLCPMQFDIADRAINQWTNPGEVVYDPFDGIGTVVQRAVIAGRYGIGTELSTPYFLDSATYAKAAEDEIMMPSMFSVLEMGGEAA
jgi:DNA modification methylase